MSYKSEGISVIARQSDCQTWFLWELHCPEDALYVAPFAEEAQSVDVVALKQADKIGSYRRAIRWMADRGIGGMSIAASLLFDH